MKTPSPPPSLVERKRYDDKIAHHIAEGIWWVGFVDSDIDGSHNPYAVVDTDEAILINPGSRAEEHYRVVREKLRSIIDTRFLEHIVVLHSDPTWSASLPLFEKLAHRNVRIYAPSGAVKAIACYGCKHPIIGLEEGDSIILRSGRTIDYHAITNLPTAGLGFLHDARSGTIFCGSVFGYLPGDWNLYAPANGWEAMIACETPATGSKKAHLSALNKIERLSPERICPQCGPILEDDIDKYLATARKMDIGK